VTLVVNTGLDAVTDVDSEGGLLISKSVVDSHVGLEDISAQVVVVLEVGKVLEGLFAGLGGTLLLADVFVVSTSSLDPSGEGSDVSGETVRGVRFVGDGGFGDLVGLLLHVVSGTGGEGGGSGEHTVVDTTFGLLVVGAEGSDGGSSDGFGLVSDVSEGEHNIYLLSNDK
jgi:hypothetical protein